MMELVKKWRQKSEERRESARRAESHIIAHAHDCHAQALARCANELEAAMKPRPIEDAPKGKDDWFYGFDDDTKAYHQMWLVDGYISSYLGRMRANFVRCWLPKDAFPLPSVGGEE